ncbi:uncharacterized protein LOC125523362 isoform X1 [Triticum urartu]|uniref:uncharacterized protein LOC125523362 isoform X1 n=1 Tax=Triticum urartu TaxID=4572 RepID=UPI002042E0ED|nr:uncharacterized protein LOC125523362 isoform X1 [Triticum urartu]
MDEAAFPYLQEQVFTQLQEIHMLYGVEEPLKDQTGSDLYPHLLDFDPVHRSRFHTATAHPHVVRGRRTIERAYSQQQFKLDFFQTIAKIVCSLDDMQVEHIMYTRKIKAGCFLFKSDGDMDNFILKRCYSTIYHGLLHYPGVPFMPANLSRPFHYICHIYADTNSLWLPLVVFISLLMCSVCFLFSWNHILYFSFFS